MDRNKISMTPTLFPGSLRQFRSVSSLNQINDFDKISKVADKIKTICHKAEEISKKASDSMNSFSGEKTAENANKTWCNEDDATRFSKESKVATDLAHDLLKIISTLPIPLCHISPQQLSILHGSILSITKWLLHILYMDPMGQMKEDVCEQNFSAELKPDFINLLSLCQDQKQKTAQTAVELAQLSAHLDLPLHLPLYTELFNACNNDLPSEIRGSAILQLCSTLHMSYPLFRDWENLLFPLILSKLKLHQSSVNKVTADEYQCSINQTCKEILTLLQVTQREFQWKLHWENAFHILKTLKEYQEFNYQLCNNDGETGYNLPSEKVQEDIYIYELKKYLTESLEDMLKNNKASLNQLVKDVKNVLLSPHDFNLATTVSKEDLQIILDQIFSQGHEDEDDEFDCDFEEGKRIQDIESIVNVKDVLDLESLFSDNEIDLNENEDAQIDEDFIIAPLNEIIQPTLSKRTGTSLKPNFSMESHLSDEIVKCSKTKPIEIKPETKENNRSSHHDLIYYRECSNQEWSLPDISSQLIKCNRNLPLKFSKEYEDELAMQLAEEEDNYDDDDIIYSSYNDDE